LWTICSFWLKVQSSWSQPPKQLGFQVWATWLHFFWQLPYWPFQTTSFFTYRLFHKSLFF
jgi:hypothetical protein